MKKFWVLLCASLWGKRIRLEKTAVPDEAFPDGADRKAGKPERAYYQLKAE